MQILIPLCFSRSMLVRTGLLFLALAGFAACGNINSSARAQDVGAYLTMEPPHADNTSPFAQPVLSLPQQPSRRFTPEMPARIMVIGDSLSQGFADAMIQRSTERGMRVVVQNRGRVGTGLARSDFHDWPADFARKLERTCRVPAYRRRDQNQTNSRHTHRHCALQLSLGLGSSGRTARTGRAHQRHYLVCR